MRSLLYSTLAVAAGCSIGRLEQRGAPSAPFDAVIVPGCPSLDDGRPSRCQIARAIWAAILWERGWAKSFITSGSDVHTPFVEADAIAQVMTALGVPAERIYLERNALHTDENMFFSLRIARALKLQSVAVASTRGHALWGCRMMIDWGQDCRSIALEVDAVKHRHREAAALHIEDLRARMTPPSEWKTMAERERVAWKRTGRRRPASWMLYPMIAVLRAAGEPWVPIPPGEAEVITWAQQGSAELAAPPAAPAPQ